MQIVYRISPVRTEANEWTSLEKKSGRMVFGANLPAKRQLQSKIDSDLQRSKLSSLYQGGGGGAGQARPDTSRTQ